MTRKRIDGYCLMDSNSTAFHLQRDQYSSVRKAWLEGAKYVDTIGLHGEALTIRLADINSVVDLSPEAVMSYVEEKRADEADDSLAGGIV